MASFEYPRIVEIVEIVESLPMTATGKILKRALKTTTIASGGKAGTPSGFAWSTIARGTEDWSSSGARLER